MISIETKKELNEILFSKTLSTREKEQALLKLAEDEDDEFKKYVEEYRTNTKSIINAVMNNSNRDFVYLCTVSKSVQTSRIEKVSILSDGSQLLSLMKEYEKVVVQVIQLNQLSNKALAEFETVLYQENQKYDSYEDMISLISISSSGINYWDDQLDYHRFIYLYIK